MPFTAKKGQRIGAKMGLFATAEMKKNNGGWIDADYFDVDK